MKAPRLILADAHLMVLDAMKNFLAKEFDVVGTFTDGNTLVKCAPDLKPDVIVLDISMPLMNGLMAGERLKQLLSRRRRRQWQDCVRSSTRVLVATSKQQ